MTKKVNISTESGSDVKTVSEAVACRIKNFRKHKKMSLDDLSQRAGISKGMLVDIEKCAANPSIAMLCKISAALGISVADIVNVASTPNVHIIGKEDIATLWTGPKGGQARLLAGTSGPNMIEIWRWVMHPGEHFSSLGHPSGTSELFHVEEGSLTLRIDNAEVIIQEGCSAVAKTDVPHQYSNNGTSRVTFTMVVSEMHS